MRSGAVVVALLMAGCVPWMPPEPVEPVVADPPQAEPASTDDARTDAARRELGRRGPGAHFGVSHLSLDIASPRVKLGTIESQGRLELAGAAAAGKAEWVSASLAGELAWETAHASEWRIQGGTITLSDGTARGVGEGTVTLFDDARGLPAIVARLRAASPSGEAPAPADPLPPGPARVPPAAPAPPPPPSIRLDVTNFWKGKRSPAHDQVCVDVTLARPTPDSTLSLVLEEAGAPVLTSTIAAAQIHPGGPLHVTVKADEQGKGALCVWTRRLLLSPGEHALMARVTAAHAGRTERAERALLVRMPRFYKVRLEVADVEVVPVSTAADTAAALTLCMSCIFARPHGTPDLTWAAESTAGDLFRSRSRPGYRTTTAERTPWWVVTSLDTISLAVFTPRAVDASTVFGEFRFTAPELAAAVSAGAPLAGAHVKSLRLDRSQVVELDVRAPPAAKPPAQSRK